MKDKVRECLQLDSRRHPRHLMFSLLMDYTRDRMDAKQYQSFNSGTRNSLYGNERALIGYSKIEIGSIKLQGNQCEPRSRGIDAFIPEHYILHLK